MSHEASAQPNTRGLLAHAQRKAEETQQRVHQAIDQLLREHHVVNFNTVAKAANVTKSYLYARADVRERIEALRAKLGQERIEQHEVRRFASILQLQPHARLRPIGLLAQRVVDLFHRRDEIRSRDS